MPEDSIGKALEKLPLYSALFCGKDGSSATTHGEGGMISIRKFKEQEIEHMADEKADDATDPERGLAIAFQLYRKGGDVIQSGFRSYHFNKFCWGLLMKEADRLRKAYGLP